MARTIFSLIKLIRYRFLLIAGLFPYALGTAIAFCVGKRFSLSLFFMGFLITLSALIGVEAFNEYFDWQNGTDRVFQLNPAPVTLTTFYVGITSFLIALTASILLTKRLGLPVLIFYVIGFLSSFFYLAPPVKLSYRGLGETAIAFSYGPLLVLASYYIQTKRIDALPLFVSMIPALQIFLIAILNQVPDYLQDRLVGKRNICVRIGRKNVMRLYGTVTVLFYFIILTGLLFRKFPQIVWLSFAYLPFSIISYVIGMKTYDNPHCFVPTIRYMVINYVIVLSLFITGYAVCFHFNLL
jgi:1,4-dihydroxy-2-naphthoate octaprenyltransferase